MTTKDRLRKQILEIEREIEVDTDILGYLKKKLVELDELDNKINSSNSSNPCSEKSLLQE